MRVAPGATREIALNNTKRDAAGGAYVEGVGGQIGAFDEISPHTQPPGAGRGWKCCDAS